MRIVIATWSRRLAGGVESYLSRLVPELLSRGHEVAVLHEADAPAEREPITTDRRVSCWSTESNCDTALASVAAWRPDVIVANGLEDPAIEERLFAIAPAVFFAHVFRGTCVSGTKSFATGGITPCSRQLGVGCMLHYFPRRCGGLSPITMVKLYRRESRRRATLGQYEAVVTFSGYIESEYVNHGVARNKAIRLPAPLVTPHAAALERPAAGPFVSLLFVGRMETLKGGHVLLDALAGVQRALGRPVRATFVGDGRCMAGWKRQAARSYPAGSLVSVDFTGWVSAEKRDQLFAQSDLLVVPSLWPEPFGLIGVEAAACGLPAAAFDVGGISEWLKDGLNGHLASDASAPALASAIVKCVRDPDVHARLRRGAREVAARHTMPAHVTALMNVLVRAASRSLGNANDAA